MRKVRAFSKVGESEIFVMAESSDETFAFLGYVSTLALYTWRCLVGGVVQSG